MATMTLVRLVIRSMATSRAPLDVSATRVQRASLGRTDSRLTAIGSRRNDTFLTELVDGSGGKLGAEVYEVLGSETANDVIRRVVARLEANSEAIMRQIQARIG